MTALASGECLDRPVGTRAHAPLLLEFFAVTLMVFPSDQEIKAIGAGGYVAALVAYVMFLAWLAATLLDMHNPLEHRSPVRIALCALWLVSLASYALMDRPLLTTTQQSGADRWLLQLVAVSGVILVASECLRSLDDIHRVLRALTWGGAFCGIVAALQYWLSLDITPYLRDALPGFSLNQVAGVIVIGERGGLNRVVGTATDPIELGVSAGMILPLAVYMAMHDIKRSGALRWIPVACIAISIPTSVSRAATLAAGLRLGVLLVTLPPARRLTALIAFPVALAGIFMSAHGLLGVLKQFFLAGTSDDSISHRVNEYPYVEQMVRQAPWFGQGGGTYIVTEVHILDNQYLTSAIELGLLGLAALAFYLVWPAVAALVARGRTSDARLRDLCAALAGSELAAVLCSGTFDSLSFPMFVGVQALVVGLIGAVWLLTDREGELVQAQEPFGRHVNGPIRIPEGLHAQVGAVGRGGEN